MLGSDNPAHGETYEGAGKHDYSPDLGEGKSLIEAPGMMISFGDNIKSLGDGKFEGYLVRFSDADTPDLVGDYFTKSTEFYVEDGATIPILYDHGLNKTIKGRKIGRATVKFDDVGMFIKGELDLRDQFEQAIFDELIVKGKAGLSSGAAPHMIERRQVKKSVNEMLRWGVAEGSVTVAPTEPLNDCYALKSYAENRIDPFADATIVDGEFKGGKPNPGTEPDERLKENKDKDKAKGKKMADHEFVASDDDDELCDECGEEVDNHKSLTARPMKGIFADKISQTLPEKYNLDSAFSDVCRDICNAKLAESVSGTVIDVEAKVREAAIEYAARVVAPVTAQILNFVERKETQTSGIPQSDTDYFYLRSYSPDIKRSELDAFINTKGVAVAGTSLDVHSAQVVTAAEELLGANAAFDESIKAYTKRCSDKIEFRRNTSTKAGRTISSSTLGKLQDVHAKMGAAISNMSDTHKNIGALMELAKPKTVEEAETLDVAIDLEMQRARTRMALVAAAA